LPIKQSIHRRQRHSWCWLNVGARAQKDKLGTKKKDKSEEELRPEETKTEHEIGNNRAEQETAGKWKKKKAGRYLAKVRKNR